ncbi:hypothetical protein, partial [Pontibacterium sp.]|uniref:hypothetical protein n=1 Tax=Pontibacterium sp. TaxID=2036026 RepID=UPI0035193E02
LMVALNTWLSIVRVTDWREPLWVVVYPINADGRLDTGQYVAALSEEHFEDMELFLQREALRYGIGIDQPLEVKLAPIVHAQPPEVPENPSLLMNVLWSLQMRFWSWQNDSWDGPNPDIRIYMRFFSPSNRHVLEHSLGLQKGMIGLVNGYAHVDYQGRNNMVAMHELMHTLGATDKYDLETNLPLWPEGYAHPHQKPLIPQAQAEVMGGRIMVQAGFAIMPKTLEQVIVGPQTAHEINWRKNR